jgi:hypothetical protein
LRRWDEQKLFCLGDAFLRRAGQRDPQSEIVPPDTKFIDASIKKQRRAFFKGEKVKMTQCRFDPIPPMTDI